jgi:hypothetical protein
MRTTMRSALAVTCVAASLLAAPATASAAPGDVSWWWVAHYTNADACNIAGFWYVANGYADVSTCPANPSGGAELYLGHRQT